MANQHLGMIALSEGELERAWRHFEESLRRSKEGALLSERQVMYLWLQGVVAIELRRLDEARPLLRESTLLARRLGPAGGGGRGGFQPPIAGHWLAVLTLRRRE